MNYDDGKDIVLKLQDGLKTGVPATFDHRDQEGIRNLIETEMINPRAVLSGARSDASSQNLKEPHPVTTKGKQLFSL